MKFIVALVGPYGVGKDVVGAALVRDAGMVRFAFADALWQGLPEVLGAPLEKLLSREWKNIPQDDLSILRADDPDYRTWLIGQKEDAYEPRTSRYHAVRWGNEFSRRTNPMVWVTRVTEQITATKEQNVVVTDMRPYSDDREYSGLRRVANETDRKLIVVELTSSYASYSGTEADRRFPDHVLDMTVPNNLRDFGTLAASLIVANLAGFDTKQEAE